MGVTWANDGEADRDGNYIAQIDLEDGSQPQTFRGRSHKDVADKLLTAQVHASRTIADLKKGIKPDPAPARRTLDPKPLSAGERMQAVADLADPNKTDAAVTRIVESRLGPIEGIREVINKSAEAEDARLSAQAAGAFAAETPDWWPSPHNKATLWNHMESNGMAKTRRNFGIAFDQLKSAGLVQMKPDDDNSSSEPDGGSARIATERPTTRQPRASFSTSIRSQDSSGEGGPRKTRPKFTRQDIEQMPAAEYKRRLETDPSFADAVNALG